MGMGSGMWKGGGNLGSDGELTKDGESSRDLWGVRQADPGLFPGKERASPELDELERWRARRSS